MFDWLTKPKYQFTAIDSILALGGTILGFLILWIVICIILAIKDWFENKSK